MTKQAVLSLSGGMDSSSLLIHLLAQGYRVIAISFDYGQKHLIEIEKAQQLCQYLHQQQLNVSHHTIRFDGLSQLLHSTLIQQGDEVPEGHYQEENMKLTVVPNRNKIFSSVIQAAALSAASSEDSECLIAMGIHAGDHEIYPDCRQQFRDLDYQAFISGNWHAERVKYYTPFINIGKKEILEDLEYSCQQLAIDDSEVLVRTITSYKPILIDGHWYSDYKSASSVERIEAFIELGKQDPIPYADENGPVAWQQVKAYVADVLNNADNHS